MQHREVRSNKMNTEKNSRPNIGFLKRIGSQNIVLTAVLMILILAFTAINPNFLKPYNLLSMAQSLVPYAILALGEMFVIASGNTDLSVGTVCIASAAIAGKLLSLGLPLWSVIPIMIAAGLIFGIINGILVAKLQIPAFIATLGTMMFVRGFSALMVADPNVFFPSGTWFNNLFSNKNGFPTGILWLALFTVISAYIAYKNIIGRYILAIGSNPEASRLSGIRSDKYVFIAYVISGIAAGIAGIFWASSFATITVATGNGMEFDAIAAVFIGGTNAAGGTACVGGSVIGMIMLVIIRSGLNFALSRFNVNINSTYLTYAMTGVIIVAAILLDIRKKRIRPRIESKLSKNKSKKAVRITAVILAALVILGALFACFGIIKKDESKTNMISVVAKGEADSFWSRVKIGCINSGDDYSYNIVYHAPEATDASHLPQALEYMQNGISNGANGIVLCSICEGFTDSLALAYDLGIPVVQFDSGVYTADIEALNAMGKNPIVAMVSTDSYGASGLCAEKCFAQLKGEIAATQGEYLIGLIQYEQSKTAENRINGFIDKFRELAQSDPSTANKCKFSVEVKPDETNNNYKIALEALAEKGARFIYAANATSIIQVSDAVAASNGRYDDIRFAAFDSCTAVVEWLKRDNGPLLLGGIVQNTIEMGYRAVECAALAAEGKDFEKEIYIDGIWFDKDNIDELIEQGVAYLG